MSCDPELVSWHDECIREADEEAALTLVALSQTSVERHDELGVPRPDSISSRVLSVSLGDVSRTKLNRPEGSKLHNLVFINYSDGTKERNGTGWHTFMRDGVWYHLGGDRKGAILYFLDFRKRKRGGDDHRWRWTKCQDQTEAKSLYKDLHFDKP
jgi:hypothetical protein